MIGNANANIFSLVSTSLLKKKKKKVLYILYSQLSFLDRFVDLHFQFCHHALRKSVQNTDHHASSHYTNMQIQMEMCRVQCLTAVSVFLSSRLRTSMPASVSWQQKESTSRVCLQRVSNSCTSAFTGTRDVDLTFRPGQRMSFVL